MSRPLTSLLTAWDKFWFAEQPLYTLGLYRIVFGVFALFLILSAYPNWDRFYGAHGMINYHAFVTYPGFAWPFTNWFSLFYWSSADWFIHAVFWLGAVAGVCFVVGYRTRLANFLLYVVFMSMVSRNPIILNLQDHFTHAFLFFCLLAPLGSTYSIDAVLAKRRAGSSRTRLEHQKRLPFWSVRYLQVYVAFIYLFGGLTKLLDPLWLDGTTLYYLSIDDHWARYPHTDFLHNELFSRILTYLTLLIELTFPFLVWSMRTRWLALGSVLGLHLGIISLMAPGICYVNIFMLTSLIIFFPPAFTRRLMLSLRSLAALFHHSAKTHASPL